MKKTLWIAASIALIMFGPDLTEVFEVPSNKLQLNK